jgi:hypothetical protein
MAATSVRPVQDAKALAEETVQWFRERWQGRPDDNAVLEAAEVVEVAGEGPGVLLLWTQLTCDQGHRRFGLMMSVRELLAARPAHGDGSGSQRWLPDLALAVVEPHGTPANADERTWFRYIP